jgi:hypothetical protein
MTKATKNPAPDRAGNTGLMWVLMALVWSGTVDGGTGIRFRMEGMVVYEGAGVTVVGVVAPPPCAYRVMASGAEDASVPATSVAGDVRCGLPVDAAVARNLAGPAPTAVTGRDASVAISQVALVRGLALRSADSGAAALAPAVTVRATAVIPSAAVITGTTHLGTPPV